MPHQALGSADHFVIERLGGDLVQGNDGVLPLQLSLLQQLLTCHLAKKSDHARVQLTKCN